MDSVLIIDDNKLANEIINDLLITWGYRTKICNNSSEVFDSVIDFKPDVILLDIMLPGMNGYAICHKLKTDQQTHRIPIIMLTVLNDMEDRIHAFDMGADAFLSKPVKHQELKNRVEWAVRYKKLFEVMEPRDNVVKALLSIMQAVNSKAYLHSIDVARYCKGVGKIFCVRDESLNQLVIGSYLHDIGRIITEDNIGHIDEGLNIISSLNMSPWLSLYIRNHHEKMNGEGYPDGLVAEQIPLNLSIITTVNRFMELEDDFGDKNNAIYKLCEECKNGYWSMEVLNALRQVIKDANFKEQIVSM